MSERRVLVVGAGVAGLAAAHRLQQAGYSVTVLEAAADVGGKTASVDDRGFVVNTGATVLAGSYTAMRRIGEEVGVGAEFVTAPAVIAVVRDGRAHVLRVSGLGAVLDFVRTPLLSGRSKLRLVRMVPDLLRARKKVGFDRLAEVAELDTESIRDYCDRRLNREICDHFLGPVMGGIYVVDGPSMSVADLWFTIWKVLLGGLLGYRRGADFWARAVASRLDVRTSTRVSSVARDGAGVVVSWEGPDGAGSERVDGVVVTVATGQVAGIVTDLDPRVRDLLAGLGTADYITVRFGLSRRPSASEVLTVAGSGQLGSLSSISYEHVLSRGSAPDGKGIVAALMYHEWAVEHWDRSDEQLAAQALADLERVEPGFGALVELTRVDRWRGAALTAAPGSHRVLAEIDRLLDPRDPVQLAGEYRAMQSVNGSVVSGEIAAARLARTLR